MTSLKKSNPNTTTSPNFTLTPSFTFLNPSTLKISTTQNTLNSHFYKQSKKSKPPEKKEWANNSKLTISTTLTTTFSFSKSLKIIYKDSHLMKKTTNYTSLALTLTLKKKTPNPKKSNLSISSKEPSTKSSNSVSPKTKLKSDKKHSTSNNNTNKKFYSESLKWDKEISHSDSEKKTTPSSPLIIFNKLSFLKNKYINI